MKTPQTTLEILKAARKLLEPEGSWTKGFFARSSANKPVEVESDLACKFCTLGAIKKVLAESGEDEDGVAYYEAQEALSEVFNDYNVFPLNDRRSTKHEHILMAYDFAILMEKDNQKERHHF